MYQDVYVSFMCAGDLAMQGTRVSEGMLWIQIFSKPETTIVVSVETHQGVTLSRGPALRTSAALFDTLCCLPIYNTWVVI